MGRPVKRAEPDVDEQRVLLWRCQRFTRPIASDDPAAIASTIRRIAQERDRLDRTDLPPVERVEALAVFVTELGHPGIARRALESEPPPGWEP